jgi:hypothetical protein
MYVQELDQRDGKLLRLSCGCCILGSCGKCFRYFNAIWKCECSLSKNTPDNPRIYSFVLRASVIDEMRNEEDVARATMMQENSQIVRAARSIRVMLQKRGRRVGP